MLNKKSFMTGTVNATFVLQTAPLYREEGRISCPMWIKFIVCGIISFTCTLFRKLKILLNLQALNTGLTGR